MLVRPTNAFGATVRTEALTIVSTVQATDALEAEGWKWEPGADGATLALNIPEKNTNENAFAIGSTPTATFRSGTIATNAQFLFADGAVEISGGSITCDATRISMSDGIYNDSGPVTISGGEVDISAQHAAIYIPGIGANDDADAENLRTTITGGDVTSNAVGPSLSFGIVSRHIDIDTADELSIFGFDAPLCIYDPVDGLPAGSLSVKKTGTPIELGSSDASPYSYVDYCSYRNTTQINLAAADYAAASEARKTAAAIDRMLYTSDSFASLDAALDQYVEGKSVLEQDEVNAMADAIEAALAALELAPVPETGPVTKVLPATGDAALIAAIGCGGAGMSVAALGMLARKRR